MPQYIDNYLSNLKPQLMILCGEGGERVWAHTLVCMCRLWEHSIHRTYTQSFRSTARDGICC